MWQVTKQKINEKISIAIIDIQEINSEFKNLIDNNLVFICEGNSGGDINTVKKDLVQLFENKDNKWKMGAIAEFFAHLYIRTQYYKQEFLYRNLEEDSIKKGFDGLFSKDNDFWLMESKSGSIKSKGITHKSKVKEAINDLSNKVKGTEKTNNPWKNAYSHASLIDVNASDSLRKDLKRLSDNFINGIYGDINDFNTIPCGTIFLDGEWKAFESENILQDIKSLSKELYGKNVFVICVTQKTIDMFLEYIKS